MLRLLSAPAQAAAALALLPWLVAPGLVQPDTKIDLVISPWRYLRRSFDAWSGHSGFGELQNQAYGYLFPMGPFFGVLHSIGMPGWAAQRAWWSLLLVVGFLGASCFARRALGLSRGAAIVAGVAYALSPRVLTLLSELSVETWPGMLMPWMLLVVHRARALDAAGEPLMRRHLARCAGVMGLLTASLGGVNATASLVPVLGTLVYAAFVLCSKRLLAALVVGLALGSAWWFGPLLVLGGYAYPFMDFIETAHITTAVTTLPAILRGASDWVAYIIDADGHPVWQSGWVVAQGTTSIVAGSALAGIGLVGLASWRRERARRDIGALCTLLGLGVLGMAAGHAGTPSGPQVEAVRSLLDGPAAAARNVHKLDPFVRLPLAIGIGAVSQRLVARARERSGRRHRGIALLAVLVALLVAGLGPFLNGRLADASGVAAWPTSLSETAREIDARASDVGGATLVLPSARTATYAWGSPGDEPLVAFAASPVAVRASAPLFHPGAQRLVDALDNDLAAHRDVDAALKAARRAGVARVVVRWGLTSAQQTTSASQYVEALARSDQAGAHRQFGSRAERYDVFDLVSAPVVTTGEPVGLLGGPESTVGLASVGVDSRRPFVTGMAGGWITDDVRLRRYNNGRPASLAFGPTLVAGDPSADVLGAKDLDYPGRDRSLTTTTVTGVSSMSSARSTSDPFGSVYLGPGTSPSAAFDVSTQTRWLTPLTDPASLDLKWRAGAPAQRLVLTGAATQGANVTGVAATVDGRRVRVGRQGVDWTVEVPSGARAVALFPLGRGTGAGAAVGFANIASSHPITAVTTVPGVVDPGASGVVLSRDHPFAEGHELAGEDDGEWARRVNISHAGTMTVKVTLKPGVASDATPALWMRHGASWKSVALGSDGGELTLPQGVVDLKASPEVERIALTPQAPMARAALGLSKDVLSKDSGVKGQQSASPVTLASRQGANAGWTTSSGRGQSVVLDGWRQGFTGTRPHDELNFRPQGAHQLALFAGALGVFTALLLTIWAGRLEALSKTLPTPTPVVSSTNSGKSAARGHATTACSLAAVALVGVASLGWTVVPLAFGALAVPSRHRKVAVVAAMGTVGPVMAALGVVDRGSVGAIAGQLITGLALLVFSADVLGVPTGWQVLRRRPRSREREPQ